MNKSGSFGMALQQALSFSDFLIRIPRAEAVFWPGCALQNLEPRILKKTLLVLSRAEPGIQMAAACCGQPTRYLFPERMESRERQLQKMLKDRGIKRIYTACPNCTLQLQGQPEIKVIPVWDTLAKHLRPEDLEPGAQDCIWHDPCPTRKDALQQRAVREILKLRGITPQEPVQTGCHTHCCGNFHMLHITDPASSRTMRQRRLGQFPESGVIASSCEGCLSAFRGEGRDTAHLLELLFGRSKTRGWGNRLKNTWK